MHPKQKWASLQAQRRRTPPPPIQVSETGSFSDFTAEAGIVPVRTVHMRHLYLGDSFLCWPLARQGKTTQLHCLRRSDTPLLGPPRNGQALPMVQRICMTQQSFHFCRSFFFFLFAGGKDQMCLSKPSSCEYITHNFLCFLQLENVSWETVQQEISNSQLLLLQFCIITATIKEPIKKLKRSLRTDFLFFHFHLCVCFGQIARRVKTLTKTRPGENRCRLLKMMTLYELSKTGCQWPAMLFSFIWLVKGNKMTELIKSDHKDGVERPEATSTDSHPRV